jgi:hypothetical protein
MVETPKSSDGEIIHPPVVTGATLFIPPAEFSSSLPAGTGYER